MSSTLRVGAAIIAGDPYWVQVREAALDRAQELPLDLISLSLVDYPEAPSQEEQMGMLEELLALELDAGARYLADRMEGHGHLLIVGDLMQPGLQTSNQSEMDGIRAVFSTCADLEISHTSCPTCQDYAEARQRVGAVLKSRGPVDGIFGLSDAMALASRDVCLSLDMVDPDTPVVGIGGTPEALAAITGGRMAATVEIRPEELGRQAIELAYQSSQGRLPPPCFEYQTRLVTQKNVAAVAAQKLNAIAKLYDRMMSARRQQQQQRLTQLETSLEISRRVGSILDHRQLSHEIANLIRANYGYRSFTGWSRSRACSWNSPTRPKPTRRLSPWQALACWDRL
jgi:ABC-type sugar transport system substrate-binding protein